MRIFRFKFTNHEAKFEEKRETRMNLVDSNKTLYLFGSFIRKNVRDLAEPEHGV